MQNQATFAIQAPVEVIWRTLLAEVQTGVAAGRARIVRQEAPRYLEVEVALGWALGARYAYEIVVLPGSSEVTGRVQPYGLRHRLANLFALGRASRPYVTALGQGLANLKQAAESRGERPA